MADNDSPPTVTEVQAARALASKTGITERQALELVRALGFNSPSLIFHAREMKRSS